MDDDRRRKILVHLDALRAYIEDGGEADLEVSPALWLVDGPVKVSVKGLDRDALLAYRPRGF